MTNCSSPVTHSFFPLNTPADCNAPLSRRPNPLANCKSKKPSICRANALAVSIPPDFLHAGYAIRVDVLDPHHFFQPKTPMSAAQTARLHASVRRFADAEAETASFTITAPA